MGAYEFHEDEAYIFRQISKYFHLIDKKSTSLCGLISTWTTHIRTKMDTRYTRASARKFVTATLRTMRNGILPPIALDGGELQELGLKTLDEYGINPKSTMSKYGRLARSDQNLNVKKKSQYCSQEQEFLFIRLAERIDDFQESKQKATKFYKDMSVQMAVLGHTRDPSSIRKWISAVTMGKWPAVAYKDGLAWAREILNKAFNLEDSSGDEEDDQMDVDREASADSTNIEAPLELADKGAQLLNSKMNGEGGAMAVDTSSEVLVKTEASERTFTCSGVQTSEEGNSSSRNEAAGTQVRVKVESSAEVNVTRIRAKAAIPESPDEYAKALSGQVPAFRDVGTQFRIIREISEEEFGYSTGFRVKTEPTDGVSFTQIRVKKEISGSSDDFSQALSGQSQIYDEGRTPVEKSAEFNNRVRVKREILEVSSEPAENISVRENSVASSSFSHVAIRKEPSDCSYEDFQKYLEKIYETRPVVPEQTRVKEVVSSHPHHGEAETRPSPNKQAMLLGMRKQAIKEHNEALQRKRQYEGGLRESENSKYSGLLDLIGMEIRHRLEMIEAIDTFMSERH